jgi:hypothetical protein
VPAALDELDELLDDRLRFGDFQVFAGEREAVAAQVDRAAEPVAERVEYAVADARELRGDLVRDVQDGLHAVSVGRSSALPCGRLGRRGRPRGVDHEHDSVGSVR